LRRKIHLHGSLAEKYGGPYDFEIDTAAEAFRALACNFRGFEADVRNGAFQIYRGPIEKDRWVDESALTMGLGRTSEIHIIPVIGGAKRGGAAKAIIGAVIMVAAIVLAIPSGGTSLGAAAAFEAGTAGAAVAGSSFAAGGTATAGLATVGAGATGLGAGIGILGITYGNVAMFGLSMMVSGIAQMLSPQQKAQSFEPVDRKPSFLFTGAVNASTQGNAVPLVYGRMRVGSVTISAGVEAIEIT
jgi:predicted phage tail protein